MLFSALFLGCRWRMAWVVAIVQFFVMISACFIWLCYTPFNHPKRTEIRGVTLEIPHTEIHSIDATPDKLNKGVNFNPFLASFSKLAITSNATVVRVTMLPSKNTQLPVVVLRMVASYAQQKQFLRDVLNTHAQLVLQKVTALRMPMPSSSIGFEISFVVLPAY